MIRNERQAHLLLVDKSQLVTADRGGIYSTKAEQRAREEARARLAEIKKQRGFFARLFGG